MANPRKFSEKIALHNQKQAEETAAFEQIMREVIGATRTTQAPADARNWQWPYETYLPQSANGAYTAKHQLSINQSLGTYRGGSLPNVNQMSASGSSIDLQGALNNLEDMKQGRESVPERPHSRERGRHATAPHRNRQFPFDKRTDVSPYGSSLYLSPPPDSSWRRTNSDSAIHQSTTNPQDTSGQRRGTDPVTARDFDQFYRDGKLDTFGQEQLGMHDMNLLTTDNMHMRAYWDPKGGGDDCYRNNTNDLIGCTVPPSHLRPKSCEVPGISIYPSQDESSVATSPSGGTTGAMQVPSVNNSNTGSLPDLTTLHFPPPLTTPLDPSEEYASSSAQPSPSSPSHMHGQQQQLHHPQQHQQQQHQQQQHQQQQQHHQQQIHMAGGSGGTQTPPASPRGASPSARHASPGPAPSPSSRRRVHHSSTSMVLGRQVRVPSHHQHPPSITVEGLTIDTNALSLDGYSGQRQSHQFGVYPQQSSVGQPPTGSPHMYPPSSPIQQMAPQSPQQHSYRGQSGHIEQSCSSAPASPTSAPGMCSFGERSPSAYYVPPNTAPPMQKHFNIDYQDRAFQLPDNSSNTSPVQNNPGGMFFTDSLGRDYYNRDLQNKTSSDHSTTPQTPTSIPDIILTDPHWPHDQFQFQCSGPGVSEAALLKAQDLAKCDLVSHSALAQLSAFDSSDLFSAEEALRAGLDPIDLDGLQILTDPDMAVISDPAAEEAFRLDRS
ncbi:CREB-regulated transcription coactivator 1-like isoform X1 [Ornithodoros turicata]|uniref:CREB-regulated transcription coactivator 1-like isoform X1 n=1 Tax=Ornithodoros turicata TaxID=34597 RepID=UPI003139A4BD